jgi:hypothetical protein
MKNPLRELYKEICRVIFRCPYWRKCPHYDRDECCEAWMMRGCGQYRKYEHEEAETVTKLHEETLNERRAKTSG